MESVEDESSEGSEYLKEGLATWKVSSEGTSVSLQEGTMEEEEKEGCGDKSVEKVDLSEVDLNKGI